ncbi:thiamine phosphate synthase [Mesonia aestuariivivens]|uniref:Thiamine phosphate synthase n=1 Tax=Mesonia aestuariivivens TaxID=2796128 RepID=A0ABS6VZ31_9FLAO|nr:thiamine phosphate synthase [Mesonia aestuariivivens]MBW2960754.1 thiamine phosphate synthase [Mesonia aestuariivivens]
MIAKLHYLTQGNTPQEHLENVQKACTSGAELVLLRLNHLSEKKVLKYAEKAREITAHFQTRLIVQDHYKVAKQIKADGVHLEKSIASTSSVRKHLHTWQLIGATAYHLEDAERLISQELDYLYLGPFQNTNPENNAASLGITGFSFIQEALTTETPLLAFGEISLEGVKAILGTGVSGLAIDDAITENFNLISAFHDLLQASSTQEKRHTFD